MKRLLLAAGLSIAIHGLLLWMEPEWLRKPIFKPDNKPVTLTLTYHKPPKPKIKPKRPVPAIKNKERISTPVQKLQDKVIAPPKQVKAPLQSVKKKLTKQIPDRVPEAHSIQKQPEMKEIPPDPIVNIIEEEVSQEMVKISPEATNQIIREPRCIKCPKPIYPVMAKYWGYKGTVVIKALVDRNGKVVEIQVLSSSGYSILDKAAIKTVKDYLYEPSMKGNEKVEMWVKFPVHFRLKINTTR